MGKRVVSEIESMYVNSISGMICSADDVVADYRQVSVGGKYPEAWDSRFNGVPGEEITRDMILSCMIEQ